MTNAMTEYILIFRHSEAIEMNKTELEIEILTYSAQMTALEMKDGKTQEWKEGFSAGLHLGEDFTMERFRIATTLDREEERNG